MDLSAARAHPRIVAGVVGVVLTFSCLSIANRLTASSGACGPVGAGTITESQGFTPFANRLSHRPDLPIIPERGSAAQPLVAPVPTSLDELPLRLTLTMPGGTAAEYFLGRELDLTMTHPTFFAQGGVVSLRFPIDPGAGGSYVEQLSAELGDRVTIVVIERFQGALTWGDPMSNGVRNHYLTWSDGVANHTLVANRSAEGIVDLARTLVCAG